MKFIILKINESKKVIGAFGPFDTDKEVQAWKEKSGLVYDSTCEVHRLLK